MRARDSATMHRSNAKCSAADQPGYGLGGTDNDDRPCIVRQQARMAFGDMEHNRSCLEQGETAFFISRNLPERMERSMRGFLHRTERKEGERRKAGPLLQAPSECACHAPVPCRDRETVQRR